jgi:hypothetical protein
MNSTSCGTVAVPIPAVAFSLALLLRDIQVLFTRRSGRCKGGRPTRLVLEAPKISRLDRRLGDPNRDAAW